jgi:glycerol-3-phosphate acyltransferase PlsY
MFSASVFPELALSILAAYLIGSIPLAALISRIRGVDIFSTGTGLAGAANVLRNVGYIEGWIVFTGDAFKGIFSIFLASWLGISGEAILIPALATLVGHWKPFLTKFRGGDGLSTLVGITIAVMPVYGLLAVVTGGAVAGIANLAGRHASVWGGIAGYGFLLVQAPFTPVDNAMVLGIVVLALMVMTHGKIGHRRRAGGQESQEALIES